MSTQKGFTPVLIVILIAIALSGYVLYQKQAKQFPSIKACTQDAKLCPDGSSVSRIGPNCEFSPCPSPAPKESTISAEINGWKTYTSTEYGYSVKYPANWYVYELKNSPYGYPGIPGPGDVIITSLPKFPEITAGPGTGDSYLGIEISAATETNPDYSFGLNLDKRIASVQKSDIADYKSFVEELIINGNKAYKEIQPDNDIIFYIPYKSHSGWIDIVMLERTTKSSEKTIVNQILSTFRFTQ